VRHHGGAGYPVRIDIVVYFLIAGYFDELDTTPAPIAERLNPIARPPLELRVRILIVREVPVPLNQSEALGVIVHVAVDLKLRRIVQRPPQPLTRARLHHQAVAVMHLRPPVIEGAPVRALTV